MVRSRTWASVAGGFNRRDVGFRGRFQLMEFGCFYVRNSGRISASGRRTLGSPISLCRKTATRCSRWHLCSRLDRPTLVGFASKAHGLRVPPPSALMEAVKEPIWRAGIDRLRQVPSGRITRLARTCAQVVPRVSRWSEAAFDIRAVAPARRRRARSPLRPSRAHCLPDPVCPLRCR